MYNLNRRLTIWTLISSTFITIAAGHGIAPVILFEVMMPFVKNSYVLKLPWNATYEDSILAAAILLLSGHIFALSYFYFKKRIVLITGLFFLWAGVIFLTHNVISGDDLSLFSLATAFPFLALSIVLFIKSIIPQ